MSGYLRHPGRAIYCFVTPVNAYIALTNLYSQDSGEKPPATFPRSGGRRSKLSDLEVHPQFTKGLKSFQRKQAHQAHDGTSRSKVQKPPY